jgi:hypothetical protein
MSGEIRLIGGSSLDENTATGFLGILWLGMSIGCSIRGSVLVVS